MTRAIDSENRRVTIYDVAKEAGVSPSTVSRTFSRPGRVSSRTARRVRSVAERLGYRADEVYRPATASATAMIGLAISDVTNPFYFPIIRGAERAASAAAYSVLLADAQESQRVEREMLRRALPHIDGLVIAGSRMSDTDLRALAKIVPVVVLNRVVVGLPCVVPDNARGVRRAVEHLGSLGHDRVTYVAGPDASWANGTRWRAATEAAEELRLSVNRLGPFEPAVEGGPSRGRGGARAGGPLRAGVQRPHGHGPDAGALGGGNRGAGGRQRGGDRQHLRGRPRDSGPDHGRRAAGRAGRDRGAPRARPGGRIGGPPLRSDRRSDAAARPGVDRSTGT